MASVAGILYSNAGITTTATVSHIIPPYYADFFRDNLYPSLYHRQLGTQVVIPRGYGDKVKIPRWQSPITSVGTATAGSTLTGSLGFKGGLTAISGSWTEGTIFNLLKGMSAEDITGITKQFVGGKGYSDKMVLVSRGNFMEAMLENLSRELAVRLDIFTRVNVTGSAHLRNHSASTGGTKTLTANIWTGKELARIAPLLQARNVPAWEDGTFVALGHPLQQFDMLTDISATGFISVARYGLEREKIYRGEVGQMYGIRWLLTNSIPRLFGTAALSATNGLSPGATGANSYIYAPDSFYSLEIEDGGIEVIHHPPGSGGSTGDPGNMQGSVTVKCHYGVLAAPTADWRLLRYAHGITLRF